MEFKAQSSFHDVPLPPPPPPREVPEYLVLPNSEAYEEIHEHTTTVVQHSVQRTSETGDPQTGRPSTVSQPSTIIETESHSTSLVRERSIRRMQVTSKTLSQKSAILTCQIRRRFLIYSVPFVAAFVAAIALLAYYLTPFVEEPEEWLSVRPGLRVPCAPHEDDQTKVTRQYCAQLGCLYNTTGATDTVPSCFINPTKTGYMTDGETRANEHEGVIKLRALRQGNLSFGGRSSTPGFKAPVLIHQAETADIYRLKFTDLENERYEVPFAVPKLQSPVGKQSQFAFEIVSKNPFSFRLMRLGPDGGRSWNTTIIDTSIGGLLLYDQFLQFVTKLPSNRVYGLGDNRYPTLKRPMGGRSYPMFARDVSPIRAFVADPTDATGPQTVNNEAGYAPRNYYGVQPFYICVENDGKAHGVLLRNSNAMEFQFLEDQALVLRSVGGILDFYVFGGPTPEEVLQQYHQVVGRPFLPPYWALGYQIGRQRFVSSADLEKKVVNNLKLGIPVEQIFIDMDYMDKGQMFTWKESDHKFAGLSSMITRLWEEHGVRVGGTFIPAVHADSEHPTAKRVYESGLSTGVFVKWPQSQIQRVFRQNPLSIESGRSRTDRCLLAKMWPRNRSAIPDFFAPATKNWWLNHWRPFHQSLPFSSIWLSRTEPQIFDTNLMKMEYSMLWTDCQGGISDAELIPDYKLQMNFALQCDPESQLEDPPYHPSSMRVWKDPDIKKFRTPLMSTETVCMDAEHHDGNRILRHYDVHNIYAMRMASVLFEPSRNVTNERILLMTRNSYPGVQRFAGRWLGDMRSSCSDLRYSFKALLEYAGLGFPYVGADLCGYWEEHGNPSNHERLCRRWTIAGAFYPLVRAHSSIRNLEHDPHSMFGVRGDAEYLDEIRKALRLRYELIPYLYTLFFKSHKTGTPVVYPLHFLYPIWDNAHHVITDDSVRTIQFFWGKALLISPLLDAGVARPMDENLQILVPPDTFYDYFSGAVVEADEKGTCVLNLSVKKIGLHGRAGWIIPVQPMGNASNTRESRKGNFTLLVFVKNNGYSVGDLYWDDGISADTIEKGDYFLSTFKFRPPDDFLLPSLPVHLFKHEILVSKGARFLNGIFISTIKFYGLRFDGCLEMGLRTENGPWILQSPVCLENQPILELNGSFPMHKNFELAFGKQADLHKTIFAHEALSVNP